jgi:membrane associated rhomboid family serine protease
LIPLRDSVRPQNKPVINWILILVSFLVFLNELKLTPPQLNQLFYHFGVIPAEAVAVLNGINPSIYLATFFTAMFLHGGWVHILGNMWFLWIFGDNVEDRLGHFRYLVFYLVTGVIGSIVFVLTAPDSRVPIVGASGAIAGVLGGYIVSFPRAKVLALVPIFFFLTLMEIPAVIFLAFWFFIQLFNGAVSLGGLANPVAWGAHIGGFLAGVLLIKIFTLKVD